MFFRKLGFRGNNGVYAYIEIQTFLKLTLFTESPLLFPYYPEKSLHFVKRQMEGIIDQCLQKPAVSSIFTNDNFLLGIVVN